MNPIILAVAWSTLALQGLAAEPPAQPRELSPSVATDFDFMTAYIARNYAGYSAKVTDEAKPKLEEWTKAIRQELAAATPGSEGEVFYKWLSFFKDLHLGVRKLDQPEPTVSAAGAARPGETGSELERIPVAWTAETLAKHLEGRERDALEGLWNLSDGRYIVAVLRSKDAADTFDGTIVETTVANWKPGELKLRISKRAEGTKVRLWLADRTPIEAECDVLADGSLISVPSRGFGWKRTWPAAPVEADTDRILPASRFFLKRLSPKTLWIRVPDFHYANQAELEGLLDRHASDLSSTDNLLIDARHNGGGQDYVYSRLIDLAYTRPIYTVGIEFLSTPENIEAWKRVAAEADRPAESREQIKRMIQRFEQKTGFVTPDDSGRPFGIQTSDKVLPFPKRIAILIDGAGSSGEQFVLSARQSRKVTLFGKKNTEGVLDYSNVIEVKLPSGRYQLLYPVSRSMRLPDEPIDGVGIPPDIRIPEATADVISFTQAWLERQVD